MTEPRGEVLLEVLSATATLVGLALVAAGLLIRCRRIRWHKAGAFHSFHHGQHYLSWHTTGDEIHEEPWPYQPPPTSGRATEVTVYYHHRCPQRWSLSAPYRGAWWLVAIGAALAEIGLLVPVVQR